MNRLTRNLRFSGLRPTASRLALLCGAVLLPAALLAGCAAQMDTPSPNFGRALNAAKDAQRLTPYDREDGLRPQARELPAGVAAPPPAAAPAGGSTWGPMPASTTASGGLIMPTGVR
ncbi:MAG: hypothetical protein FGM40_06655 [Rhodocyclaceae bacterium]|nr:hypothetical protein [Rhodocyclaceae bacterium]